MDGPRVDTKKPLGNTGTKMTARHGNPAGQPLWQARRSGTKGKNEKITLTLRRKSFRITAGIRNIDDRVKSQKTA